VYPEKFIRDNVLQRFAAFRCHFAPAFPEVVGEGGGVKIPHISFNFIYYCVYTLVVFMCFVTIFNCMYVFIVCVLL